MRSYQRLAQHGITFLNVQTAAPWTLPSMATAFTGRRVPEHGAMHIAGPVEYSAIDTSVPTLAERLSAYGYDTAAVLGGNLFVGRRFGFARGFDLFDHAFERGTHALPRGLAYTTIARPIMARAVGVLGSKLGIPGLKSARSTRDAEAIVDRAKQIVADQRDRPLFLWLHFMDCHLPYEHNKKLSSSFQAAFRAARRRKRVAPFAPYWYTPEARQSLWDAYNKEVGHIDRAIEQFLGSVMAPGHDRGRVIVLVSDHGEEFLEHGSFEHGHSLYQEVVGIPLIISDTRQATRYGTVVRDVVGLIDLAPTLLAAAGIADPLLPGHDLFRETGPTPRVTENLLYSPVPDDRFARRDGHWKAIVWRGGRTELYDLAADPNETHDLAGSSPAVVERMAAPLEAVASRQPRPVALSEAEREQLRALGYLGND